MKIIVVTTDEPFYLPLTMQRLLESSIKSYIRHIILLPPTSKKRRWQDVIAEQMRFGFLYFVIRSIQYVFFKLFSKLNIKFGGRYYSVASVATAYSIPLLNIQNINSDEAMEFIKNESPELIISLSASQIFTKKIICIPKWATLNVHNAPLPRYQGLMPSFWVLHHGEKETASTVHLMDEKIDTGDIIVQKHIPIVDNETLDSLIKKTKILSVDALVEAIDLFKRYNGMPPVLPNRAEDATYFGFPSRKEIVHFKRMGRKVLWKGIY
jgi:methionyl-tRNA formyltransferase